MFGLEQRMLNKVFMNTNESIKMSEIVIIWNNFIIYNNFNTNFNSNFMLFI